MKCNRLGFVFLILYFENLDLSDSQADHPHSNGHIPDYDPEFEVRRIYGVHHRRGVANSEDYGPIPSNDVDERNRIVKLAEGREGSAGAVRVFDLYETNNPATKTTVNGFLCREANVMILLEKTADSKYNKIRFDHYLRDHHVAALGQANQ